MAMTVIWTGMTALSLFCALALGNQGQLAAAALEGAGRPSSWGSPWRGVLCLWMGGDGGDARAGLAEKLARLLHPVLRRLFPDFAGTGAPWTPLPPTSRPTSWGWATPPLPPLGLEADRAATPGVAGDSLCMLVVCNTASIQLIPTTVAAVRMAAGCQTPLTSCRRCG